MPIISYNSTDPVGTRSAIKRNKLKETEVDLFLINLVKESNNQSQRANTNTALVSQRASPPRKFC